MVCKNNEDEKGIVQQTKQQSMAEALAAIVVGYVVSIWYQVCG